MKKFFALLLACMLAMTAVCAAAEINVTMRGLSQVQGLDKNVNHILVVLQDGSVADTIMLASINSRSGRAVMTRVDCGMPVEVTQDDGTAVTVPVGEVYVMGGKKSRGLLMCRELNELLGLNISTYVALDIAQLPGIVDKLGMLNMPLEENEAAALGKPWDYVDLTGEEVLAYVRLALPGDSPVRSRCYDALMQLIKQGVRGGDVMGLVSMGAKMLKSMDTNLNPMTAMTLVGAVQAGEDRREVYVPADMAMEDVQAMIRTEIYE